MKTTQVYVGGGIELLLRVEDKGYCPEVIDPITGQLSAQLYVRHLFDAMDYINLTRNNTVKEV